MKTTTSARFPRVGKTLETALLTSLNKKPLMTLGLVICLAGLTSGQTKFVKKEPVKIGYSVFDLQQPYWQAYTKGVQDACKAAGYQCVVSDQKSNQQAVIGKHRSNQSGD